MEPASNRVRSPVRTETVPADQAGRRLDNFLLTLLVGVPRTRVYRLIRRGEVRVEGRRANADYRLAAGDRVRIPPLTERPHETSGRIAPRNDPRLRAAVLHEDAELLIIDKPAGLAVHGGSGLDTGLIESLRGMRGPDAYLELAHRLDRDTSGCVMIAKSRKRLASLHAAQRLGTIDKRYLLLVSGSWPATRRRVESRLLRVRGAGPGAKVRTDASGQYASTDFQVQSRFRDFTLIEARLGTGRTHQIRVQVADAGHPLAGDDKYGSFEVNRALRKQGLRRLFLHADSLRIPATDGYEAVHVTAPLPAVLAAVLQRLPRDGG